jgi:hypothetical protein
MAAASECNPIIGPETRHIALTNMSCAKSNSAAAPANPTFRNAFSGVNLSEN